MTATASTPSIKRRLIAMVYETFLLLAVNMLAVALWLVVTRGSQAPLVQLGLKAFLFVVNGAYFVHAWTGSSHTLAMKTWRMRIVRADAGADPHARVTLRSALLRYLLAWFWFLPGLIACAIIGPKSWGQISTVLGVGVLAWALTAFLDRDRQFLHDRLAGTRLVSLAKPVREPAASDAAGPAPEAS